MSYDAATAVNDGASSVPSPPPAAVAPAEHPELTVGAAFAGGLALALLLKRLAH